MRLLGDGKHVTGRGHADLAAKPSTASSDEMFLLCSSLASEPPGK
jgi:hypothetical protein